MKRKSVPKSNAATDNRFLFISPDSVSAIVNGHKARPASARPQDD
ncbi:hypothetical protein RHECNPAF_770080 [Rhizobium etli CNPAF512]|nr:hypothetical protein RHECNPAF_770080 [Rhizobium etli CNPAF512]